MVKGKLWHGLTIYREDAKSGSTKHLRRIERNEQRRQRGFSQLVKFSVRERPRSCPATVWHRLIYGLREMCKHESGCEQPTVTVQWDCVPSGSGGRTEFSIANKEIVEAWNESLSPSLSTLQYKAHKIIAFDQVYSDLLEIFLIPHLPILISLK